MSRRPPPAAASMQKPQPGRLPRYFRDAMSKVPVKPADTDTPPVPDRQRAVNSLLTKWKSSFQPVGEQDGGTEDKSTSSPEKVELYDPYNPGLSDSEHETPLSRDHRNSPLNKDSGLQQQHLPPRRGHWDCELRQPVNRCEFSPKTVPAESRGLSLGQRLPEQRSPDSEAHNPLGYGSMKRPVDHRVCSPDRPTQGSPTMQFPASHGGEGTNWEDGVSREVSPVRPKTTSTVRLSPPSTQQDFQHQMGHTETRLDKFPAPREVTRNRRKAMSMGMCPSTCDLCDVEVANAQELEDHLESKTHWDTLEHIQLHNHYDDMAVAFLQEVLLYKSHQSSPAIDSSSHQALEENHHMTKIEVFHCASCKVFIPTAVGSVQAHVTSQEHITNTEEFEMHQRHDCLQKAETIMKELKPQFEHFLKGGSPFQ